MSDRVKELMAKYAIDKSEIWQLPGGRSYAVKHSAVERIAAQEGVLFHPPQIVEGNSFEKMVVLMGTAKLGERVEWSFGEASPANNKNAYPWAMAEKRLKDRLTLKLIEAHGLLYSDDELSPDPPMQITSGPKKSSHAVKRDTPDAWPNIVQSFRNARSYTELRDIAASEYVQEATKDWPVSWTDQLREEYQSLADTLRDRVAA